VKRVRAAIEHEWAHRRWVWLCVASVAAIVLWAAHWGLGATAPVDSFTQCAQAGYPVTETDPPICSAAGHQFVGARTAASPAAEAPAVSQPFDLLVDGDNHGSYPHKQEVISNEADWERYWRTVHAALSAVPPLIPVDFAASSVIALSEGRQPTGGYGLKVQGIMTSDRGTVVDVLEETPAASCHPAATPSDRYLIVRTGHLPEPVTFRITNEQRGC
jgi:hypothetical protein